MVGDVSGVNRASLIGHEVSERLDKLQLESGELLLAYSIPLETDVSFFISVRAGSAFERIPGTSEVAWREISASALTRGLRMSRYHFPPSAICRTPESVDYIAFSGRCPPEYCVKLVITAIDCLSNPVVASEGFELSRNQIVSELAMLQKEPRFLALAEFVKATYPSDHPYSRLPIANRVSVEQLTTHEISRFVKSFYVPSNIIVVLTGAINHDILKEISRGLSGGRSGYYETRKDDVMVRKVEPTTTVVRDTRANSNLAIGCSAVSRNHPEWGALTILNFALGEPGFLGRIAKMLRDRLQLVYELDVTMTCGQFGGHWLLQASASLERVDCIIETVKGEILRLLAEPFSRGELNIARTEMSRFYRTMLSTGEFASQLIHELEFYGLGLQSLEDCLIGLDSIQGETLQEAALKYFTASNLHFCIADATNMVSRCSQS